MALRREDIFQAAAGLLAAGLLGTAGLQSYASAADISENVLGLILLASGLFSAVYALLTVWRGLTNRRRGPDRRQPVSDSFTGDRRIRNLGYFGPDRRVGPPDRRVASRRRR